MIDDENQILFFDGVCGLCNRVVDFLLSVSSGQPLKFAPLQGETARRILGDQYINDLDTLVYYRSGTLYTKSTAVGMILRDVGGFPALGSALLLIPKAVRDYGYDLVATNRYKIFGKKDSCRVPTPEERARFCQ